MDTPGRPPAAAQRGDALFPKKSKPLGMLQVVPRTREGKMYQAYVRPALGRRPARTEQEEQRAGKPVPSTYFMSSVAGREKQQSDALPFDAVGDAEHHRADGAAC